MRTPDLQARSVVAILAPILGFFTVLVVTIWTIKLHIQKIYVFPSPSVCVFLDLRTNSDNSPVEHWLLYRGCPGRNVPDFGRMFLKLKSTDLTQNTYIRSWTVTERMAREKCGLLAVPRTVPVSRVITRTLRMSVLQSHSRVKHIPTSLSTDVTVTVNCNSILLDIHVPCKVLGNLRTCTVLVRVYVV